MQANPAVNQLASLFPLIAIFIIFYFLLIRPQKAREKEHKNMLAGLNKNDAVVTSSGIHGTLVNVKEKTVILRIDDNVKIELEKSQIAYKKSSEVNAQGN